MGFMVGVMMRLRMMRMRRECKCVVSPESCGQERSQSRSSATADRVGEQEALKAIACLHLGGGG